MPKPQHENECKCAICAHGVEAHDDWAQRQAKEHGWYAHFVTDRDDQSPTGFNCHTHGMSDNLHHPDFQIVFPMQPELCMQIFHLIAKRIKEGKRFENGRTYQNVLGGGFEIAIATATECERDVLRIIVPDKDGVLGPLGMKNPAFAIQWNGTR